MKKSKRITAFICAVCAGISMCTASGFAADADTAAPTAAPAESAAPTASPQATTAPTSTPQATAAPDEKDTEKATETPMPTSTPNVTGNYGTAPEGLTVTPHPRAFIRATPIPQGTPVTDNETHATEKFEKDIDGWRVVFTLMEPDQYLEADHITKVSPNASKTLTIPAVVNGYWVEGVGGIGPENADAPEKIIISEGIRSVGGIHSAAIKELVLPSTLKEIGYLPGTSIKKLTIPSPDCLFECSFEHMDKLEEVILPESLTVIPNGCFRYCTALKKITLPAGLTRIEERAFSFCTSLESINIPDGIKNNLSTRVFIECPSLKNVSFNGEITENIVEAFVNTPFIKEQAQKADNKMFIFNNKLLSYAGSDKNIIIPDNVTEITSQCFMNKDITSVTFPSGLRTIGDRAFWGTKLKEVHIPASVKKIGTWAFSRIDTLEKLVIDDEKQFPMLSLGAFEGCGKLSDVTLPKSASIAAQAFLDTPFGGNDTDGWYITTGLVPERPSSAGALPKPTASPAAVDMNAASPDEERVLSVQNENDVISVSVSGKGVQFTDAAPFIDENDRTQLPIRAVAESIGCKVDYDTATRTVSVKGDDESIVLSIGDENMIVNGKTVKMDTAARIVNDRTYIPVRFVAEALGFEVDYLNTNQN